MSSIWILFGGFSRLKWKRGPQADWGYIRLWHSRIVAVQQIYNSANVLWLRKTILKSVCFDFWVQTRCVGMRGIFLTHVRFSSRTILWVLSAVHLHKTSYQSVFSPADSASPSMPSTQSASVAYFLAESSYISWSSVGGPFLLESLVSILQHMLYYMGGSFDCLDVDVLCLLSHWWHWAVLYKLNKIHPNTIQMAIHESQHQYDKHSKLAMIDLRSMKSVMCE